MGIRRCKNTLGLIYCIYFALHFLLPQPSPISVDSPHRCERSCSICAFPSPSEFRTPSMRTLTSSWNTAISHTDTDPMRWVIVEINTIWLIIHSKVTQFTRFCVKMWNKSKNNCKLSHVLQVISWMNAFGQIFEKTSKSFSYASFSDENN